MINIKENISLAPMTYFGIGGDARFFAEVSSVQQLEEAIRFARKKSIDFEILGGGTNVLVNGKGFDGLMIRLKNEKIRIKGKALMAEAGAPLLKIITSAAEKGLSGLEPLAGIPGTLGGAVRGNAGAYGAEISERIKNINVFDAESLEEKTLGKKDAGFGYRTSIFKKNKNLIIFSADFELKDGNPEEISKKVKELLLKRNSRGLYGYKSAGSFFMNPEVSDEKLREEFTKDSGSPVKGETLPAGWLIEKAGLLGKKIGGAQVCEKHANFIINTGDATAEDVIILASLIKQQVRDKFNVQLQEEINYVGF